MQALLHPDCRSGFAFYVHRWNIRPYCVNIFQLTRKRSMLSRFFGKSDKSDDSPTKEALDKRGIVSAQADPDPDKVWRDWSKALAAQDADKPIPLEQLPPSRVAAQAPTPSPEPATQAAELDFELDTEQAPLEQLTPEQRKTKALDTVDRHHPRIANTLRTLWGYKECGVYINKLIMAGGDGMGQARVGFNQEVVQAMLDLSDLHDSAFGAPDTLSGDLGMPI